MNNEYVILNKVQSHLITWGNPFNCNRQDVIICITGNPGVTDFYEDFGSSLHKSTGLPVCVIGQAGHEEVPDEDSNVLKGQEHLFNLEGQIKHKLELIRNHIDKDSHLHLVGHSIGAWLILEMLREDENLANRLLSVNLLFPTLQYMAETNNGKFLNKIVRNIHGLILLLFYVAYFLPVLILTFLVEQYLKMQRVPLHYTRSISKFLRPAVGEKVLFLAYNEMDTVKQLNTEVIERIKHLTNVIYSKRDGWAPVSYMQDLNVFQPQLHLNEVDIDHAFVLKSSERVAAMVSNFIKSRN